MHLQCRECTVWPRNDIGVQENTQKHSQQKKNLHQEQNCLHSQQLVFRVDLHRPKVLIIQFHNLSL